MNIKITGIGDVIDMNEQNKLPMECFNIPLCSIREMMDKQVVNVCDGLILGYIDDFIIDKCIGRLVAVTVPCGGAGIFCLPTKNRLRISWEQIEKIGDDVILVRVDVKKAAECIEHRKKCKEHECG
ncbi:hypothetical protein SDC9_112060 [bioreactor metagenome]|uniref:PRC-barrel domain-containing protein n=1 Tax=bioreactor metagenome TaxID=1076179 RepID=A0A645BJA4_9ZZZZ|nr:YlmC/YmxH family sporulation protein [Oscillospiraceae bacterium]